MIGYLSGTIHAKDANWLIVDVSGVGYRVFVTDGISYEHSIGHHIKLYIHHHFSENNQALYGFLTLQELDFFHLLISINGVGPKMALGILTATSV